MNLTEKTVIRFFSKIQIGEPTACWPWRGSLFRAGYGAFSVQHRMYYAHRVAFALGHGSFPAVVDHACRNRTCCNPLHLRAVTPKQNNENHNGQGRANNRSGARGVFWLTREQRWCASVGHYGAQHRRTFDSFEDAKRWAIETRNRLFTHNDADRPAS